MAKFNDRYGIPGAEISNLSRRWHNLKNDCTWRTFDEFVFFAATHGYRKGLFLIKRVEFKPHGDDNSFFYDREYEKKLQAERIADRIDAEHEAKVSYWQGASYKDGYDEGFASADDWLAQNEDAMAEHGWVRLPVDADGVPIRVGDVMDEQLLFGGYAAPAPVDTMELSRGAGGYGWMVRLDSESGAFINPKLLRHHHAPTVEDVLREFALKVAGEECMTMRTGVVEEYAAKLRLVDDEE